ncbi:hypothetical protein QBZ16_003917 [Prototheca wickerhamii]|uniref:Uncharacterized protein n=1 Tax=Prototheca wickerhamii TaxID=3111 RepID=A0AAD9IGI8_PROWI|nr:hypothetical protein QBZ16_003917 [Prototheca wickerhamii]
MWQQKFGFGALGPIDTEILEERLVMPEGATLLCRPCAAGSRPGRRSLRAAAADKGARPVRKETRVPPTTVKKKVSARFTKRLGRGGGRANKMAKSYCELSESDGEDRGSVAGPGVMRD